MADPRVTGGQFDAAARREKLEQLQKERQRKFAETLRRNKIEFRIDRTDKSPEQMERDYAAQAEARLERELYAAGARGGVGGDEDPDA